MWLKPQRKPYSLDPETQPAGRDSLSRVLVLVGPTASGKTAVSLLIAGQLNAEIVSADSRQVYRYLDIGTAKPPQKDRKRVRHHFVDCLTPDHEFNAGEFGRRGRKAIEGILRRGMVPLVVGGSGLYIQALVDGIFEGVPADPEIRQDLHRRLARDGPQRLLSELAEIDPVSAGRMLPSNVRRIVRALEVYKTTGTPISELQNVRIQFNFRPVFAGLSWDRADLYGRINGRVDWMIAQGLVEEVRKLQSRGYSPDLNALRTTGYQEVFAFLEGRLSSEEMASAIKRQTRRYAKRQMTWFRRDTRIRWFHVRRETEFPAVASAVCSFFLSA